MLLFTLRSICFCCFRVEALAPATGVSSGRALWSWESGSLVFNYQNMYLFEGASLDCDHSNKFWIFFASSSLFLLFS